MFSKNQTDFHSQIPLRIIERLSNTLILFLITGEYRIGLKFNEQHIPDSPFKVYISPAVGDAHLLEVAQFPDSAQVDKPTQFYIRLNGAKGSLDGRVSKKFIILLDTNTN